MIGAVGGAQRHAGICAVDRRGRCINQMLAAGVSAAFEDVQEPDDVGVGIGVRIVQRMADAGLGGQMDDGVEAIGGKQFAKRRAIGDVALLEVEIRVSGEYG